MTRLAALAALIAAPALADAPPSVWALGDTYELERQGADTATLIYRNSDHQVSRQGTITLSHDGLAIEVWTEVTSQPGGPDDRQHLRRHRGFEAAALIRLFRVAGINLRPGFVRIA